MHSFTQKIIIELFTFKNFYIGYESDKKVNFCDITIHLGNFHLEYNCPSCENTSRYMRKGQLECREIPIGGSNGAIQKNHKRRHGEASESNGAF